jgi:hypothetical protein
MNPTLTRAVVAARNFLMLALVTVLIWLLAEAESLMGDRSRVELAFRAEQDSGRYIRAEEFPGAVTVRLEGSTAAVDELNSRFRRAIRLEPGMEGIPLEPGRHSVDLRTVLRALPLVREAGATIVEVDPPNVMVVVDNLVMRDAKVRVETPLGSAVDGIPEANPATVQLRMPEAHARQITEEFHVIAALDATMLSGLPAGRSILREVRLDLPERLRGVEGAVRMQPSTVSVTLTLRSRTDSTVLNTVPVHVRLAPTETGMWDITMPAESRILNDVTVMGPSDQIASIREGRLRPIAYVPVSFEELEKAAASGEPLLKEPVFSDLPLQLRIEINAPQKVVQLSVKRRAQPAAPPPAPAATPGTTGAQPGATGR